jgi:hypothetical protein
MLEKLDDGFGLGGEVGANAMLRSPLIRMDSILGQQRAECQSSKASGRARQQLAAREQIDDVPGGGG